MLLSPGSEEEGDPWTVDTPLQTGSARLPISLTQSLNYHLCKLLLLPRVCRGRSGGADNPGPTLLELNVPWEKRDPSPESGDPESLRLGARAGASLDVREDLPGGGLI